MPLVVPILRLGYVFLNVFDTFKTLRPPPPSARNGGQPSARAMSARKRAMKGVMTVWMVWACFTLYERWVETFVWLFVPFYSEIKSLFILFFLLTRAKGAEPVFLHVIRPIIKPYTVPLDALCDTVASFFDLLILVASIPVNHVLGFYRRWWKAYDPPQADPKTWHRDSESMTPRPSAHRTYVSESNGDAAPATKRQVSNGSIKQTRSVIQPRSNAAPANGNGNGHQVWRPPVSAYDVEDEDIALNPHSGLPTPPLERQQRKQLGGIVAPKPVRAGNAAQLSGLADQQDFRKSLPLPREPRNPGSDGDSSDDNDTKGVQSKPDKRQTPNDFDEESEGEGGDAEEDAEMNGDEITPRAPWQDEEEEEYESDMEEDVFNTTLATPGTRRRYREDDDSEYEAYLDDTMLTPPPMKKAFSVDSAATQSTSLSTTDNGSSFRTTRSLSSDGSSLADKKQRAPPKYAGDEDKFSVDVPPRKAATSTRGSTIGRTRGKALQAAADDDDVAETDADAAPEGKSRVVNGRTLRPKPPRADSQGTIRGPSARGRGASAARGAARGASRIAVKERSKPVVKKAGAGAAAGAGAGAGAVKPIGAAAPKVVPKAAKPVQKDAA